MIKTINKINLFLTLALIAADANALKETLKYEQHLEDCKSATFVKTVSKSLSAAKAFITVELNLKVKYCLIKWFYHRIIV